MTIELGKVSILNLLTIALCIREQSKMIFRYG